MDHQAFAQMADSYLRRNDVIERSATQIALSKDLAEFALRASEGTVDELTDLERSRLQMWESASKNAQHG
jgi:hypothetical protein